MQKSLFLLLLLFAGVLLLFGCSTNNAKTKAVYTVATGSNYVPFEFLNEKTGELDGFDIDLMKAIAKEANFEIRFETLSWDGFLTAMQTGRYDMGVNAVNITEERKKKLDFSDPYYSSGLTIMVNANDHEINLESDYTGKEIGVVTQTASEIYVRENFPKAKISAYGTSPDAYMDLRAGRIDAVINDIPSIKYFISKEANGEFRTVKDIIQSGEYGILFPKGSDLKEQVNQALKAIIKKGIYDDIYEKWFNERPYGTRNIIAISLFKGNSLSP